MTSDADHDIRDMENSIANELNAMQERAVTLIKPLIPADAEDRVRSTVRQFNAIVRDHIRAETLFKLSDDSSKNTVGVEVVDGFPAGVVELINKYDDGQLWWLIMLQPRLGAVVEGL